MPEPLSQRRAGWIHKIPHHAEKAGCCETLYGPPCHMDGIGGFRSSCETTPVTCGPWQLVESTVHRVHLADLASAGKVDRLPFLGNNWYNWSPHYTRTSEQFG